MKTITRRVENIERKLDIGQSTPQWAIDLAEKLIFFDKFRKKSLLALHEAMRRDGEEPGEIKDENFPYINKTVSQLAEELASKYSSFEDYKKTRPLPDIGKLNKAIAASKDELD